MLTRDEIEKCINDPDFRKYGGDNIVITVRKNLWIDLCDMALRCLDYDERLTAVMPPDMKDWHQNSRDEWPEVAASTIVNLNASKRVPRSVTIQIFVTR